SRNLARSQLDAALRCRKALDVLFEPVHLEHERAGVHAAQTAAAIDEEQAFRVRDRRYTIRAAVAESHEVRLAGQSLNVTSRAGEQPPPRVSNVVHRRELTQRTNGIALRCV